MSSQPVAPEMAVNDKAFRSLPVPHAQAGFIRKLFAFAGPGFLVAVGYMDPGNWATDLAAGSAYGYKLLTIILLSNMMALALQALAAKLGVATGRDLAQACRQTYGPAANFSLWVLAEIGICACDLAELIGTAIGLKLLFSVPLLAGIVITIFDVLLVLLLQQRGFRLLEALIVGLIAMIAMCLLTQLVIVKPNFSAVLNGFAPSAEIVRNPKMLYLAVGILGATIMPHNLYLHSSIVQTRRFGLTLQDRGDALRFIYIDSAVALFSAMFMNAAILIVAASAFYMHGHSEITQIEDAYRFLTPIFGAGAAMAFALALLLSGQNSALTGTLAGQIVMEGFTSFRIKPWQRRLLTRAVAAFPAVGVVWFFGDAAIGKLLIFSQVVLALQLPFAMIPLIRLTGNSILMGQFANSKLMSLTAWAIASAIILLNASLIYGLACGGPS